MSSPPALESALDLAGRDDYIGSMQRSAAIIMALGVWVVGPGCVSFDSSGVSRGDSDGGAGNDADVGCPERLHSVLEIDGSNVDLDNSRPLHQVLVGDTVALSAEKSCAQNGPLTFTWSIAGPTASANDTVEPSLDAAAITMIAMTPGSYTVNLRIEDAGRSSRSFAFRAFEAVGPSRLHRW